MSSPVPGAPAAVVDLAEVAGRLGARLRDAGLAVGTERSSRFAAALALVAPATADELYWLARVILVGDRTDLAAFDGVFAEVFGGAAAEAVRNPDAPASQVVLRAAEPAPAHAAGRSVQAGGAEAGAGRATAAGQADEPGATPAGLAAVSAVERLRRTDFAALGEAELEAVRALLAGVRVVGPPRPARRRTSARRGDRLDLRATLARAQRTGGDPARRIRTRRRTRARRVVLLCDVSGSMEPYARAYLVLLHAAVRRGHAEAFAFATRLTRLTRELALRSPAEALARAGAAPPDWAGGTRIGAALRAFLDEYGRRGMARGAVVVIVSDGWEGEDPDLLGEQMRRLARLAHRVVWVNPRRASPRYTPLVAGMAAALPSIDRFVSGHSVDAVDEVLDAITDPHR